MNEEGIDLVQCKVLSEALSAKKSEKLASRMSIVLRIRTMEENEAKRREIGEKSSKKSFTL